MPDIPRVEPREVRDAMLDPQRDIELVCAYDDDAKCRRMPLAGAQTLSEFRARQEEIPTDRRIVFYCA